MEQSFFTRFKNVKLTKKGTKQSNCDTHSTNDKKEPGGVEDNKRTIMDTNNIYNDDDDDHQQVQQEQQAAAAAADQRHINITEKRNLLYATESRLMNWLKPSLKHLNRISMICFVTMILRIIMV